MPTTEARPLHEIAAEIKRTWPKPFYAALPYLDAMQYLTDMSSRFGDDDAKGVVLYFLSNAKTWRGDDARRIKAELKALVK